MSTASSLDNYDNVTVEIQRLEKLLHDANIPHELWEKANMQLQRVNLGLRYGGNVNQLDMIVKYVEWITHLPWNKVSPDILDINKAKEIMDQNHYGLAEIKKRILEYISMLILQKQNKPNEAFHAPILLFVGLAGTGKTTFAQSIASVFGRQFVRIPFGGLSSALDLRGVSKVQPEAEPGLVIKSLRRVGTRNPVILLDELDRTVDTSRGAIMGVLLELLDPKQNGSFIDHYVDFPFDLSQVLFVATANNTQDISTAVMDRLEVIQMPSYTDDEKIFIARDYILPRLMKESGLPEQTLTINEEVWRSIARASGYDPGIRSVERKVESIVRTAALKMVSGGGTTFTITAQNMREFVEG
ncbi:hypothetical protein A3B02_00035 [Candidatus Roizmanbacteria bacterium RIFCSPLOWO2_01_FULL_42_14]|uniref:AAA+ ATPase domain-containing protein n=4 Tax=Candidatus Roizmaniibacteriota TaxID=1752723 RepID=A0A1F7K1C7_9BACT|nr:MAG: hypothetical protein A3D08_03355 [Candidatus Roizmanbacteria bacterium RIFCSPHIGHO2_02_FULL_43_11]OGK38867.1 MAG: hypothetical protein A3F32_02650 [Candidatus Roizmanbacteria bacterium RIFCSPHIGHO2_12_FULL_42_10]OGK52517.1 MAG: hypothetical protein A3B02_00035 [Candidatus Roizmanbacteria bacterium RIFCSPLOWO2_01_FULL_42_14]OGK61654.1 MAG: hypothetical protein A3I56_04895 [Candidatus Roizmanbacteria bacterium RIFCSPLOWO2_02_FULL_43_10]